MFLTNPHPLLTIYEYFSIKSIILNHLAFHLRQVYHAEEATGVENSSGSVRFQSFIVGNAGAPLHSILMDSHEDIEVERSSI